MTPITTFPILIAAKPTMQPIVATSLELPQSSLGLVVCQ